MRVTFKFNLGDQVIEKATKIEGRIVIVAADDVGHCYTVQFAKRIHGRKQHWKREGEIELAPAKPKKKKRAVASTGPG